MSFPTWAEACACPWCLQQVGVHCFPDATMEFWFAVLFLPSANTFSSVGALSQEAAALGAAASCSLSIPNFKYRTVNPEVSLPGKIPP